MIPARPTHLISEDDVQSWLAAHGLDVEQAFTAVVRVDRCEPGGVSAFLEVEHYLLDADGNRFVDETGEKAATATATVPLTSWPPLTPAGS